MFSHTAVVWMRKIIIIIFVIHFTEWNIWTIGRFIKKYDFFFFPHFNMGNSSVFLVSLKLKLYSWKMFRTHAYTTLKCRRVAEGICEDWKKKKFNSEFRRKPWIINLIIVYVVNLLFDSKLKIIMDDKTNFNRKFWTRHVSIFN